MILPVNTPLVEPMLPTFALPDTFAVAPYNPRLAVTFEPIILPDAATLPLVVRFPPMTLPITLAMPVVFRLLPVTLPDATTCPLVLIFPPVILPVTLAYPVRFRLPIFVVGSKSMTIVLPGPVMITPFPPGRPLSRRNLNVLVSIGIEAMLALTTTLPVGELTCIPIPGVLLTELTAAPAVTSNNSSKFVCTF